MINIHGPFLCHSLISIYLHTMYDPWVIQSKFKLFSILSSFIMSVVILFLFFFSKYFLHEFLRQLPLLASHSTFSPQKIPMGRLFMLIFLSCVTHSLLSCFFTVAQISHIYLFHVSLTCFSEFFFLFCNMFFFACCTSAQQPWRPS